MAAHFPSIDCIRSVFRHFRPKDLEGFEAETGIKMYWVKAFIFKGLGAKHPPYERIVTIVNWLKVNHGVTFLDNDTYVVRPVDKAA